MEIQEIIQAVRDVMDELGIENHLPTAMQINEHGYITYYMLNKFGGLKNISKIMGLPMAPAIKPKKYQTKDSDPDSIYISKKSVIPSQAFKKQAESGIPYGEIQKAQSLEIAGTIDKSRYTGMLTYAERMMANGSE